MSRPEDEKKIWLMVVIAICAFVFLVAIFLIIVWRRKKSKSADAEDKMAVVVNKLFAYEADGDVQQARAVLAGTEDTSLSMADDAGDVSGSESESESEPESDFDMDLDAMVQQPSNAGSSDESDGSDEDISL